LRKELRAFDPPPYIRAAPLETNMQEWRFVLQGPHDSPYEGGMYQGKIKFPDDYPFKPPSIYMLTPNGRFETDRRLCLSISDFHPESWIPTWSVASIINGVLSFMLEDAPTTGSVATSLAEKRRLAGLSVTFNQGDSTFRQLFPGLVDGQPFTAKPSSATAAQAGAACAESAPPAAVDAGADVAAGGGSAAALANAPTWPASEAAGTADAEATADDLEPMEPGSGKNASKNRRRREKAAAKKREAATLASGVGGAGMDDGGAEDGGSKAGEDAGEGGAASGSASALRASCATISLD